MLPSSTEFLAKHNLAFKTPLWLVHFDGELIDYVNLKNAFSALAIPDDPVGYWPFDEGFGATAEDKSGNENDGTLEGTTYPPVYIPGVSGTALNFVATAGGPTAGRVNCGNPAPLDDIGNGDFSFSFFMQAGDQIISFGNLFSKRQDLANRIALGSSSTDNRVRLYLQGPGSDNFSVNSTIFDGELHHIALVINRTTDLATLWIDGVKDSEEIDISGLAADISNTGDLSWGARDTGSNPFLGMIDEPRVFDRVLTEEEIEALYQYGKITKDYLIKISSLSRTVTPEEGKASVSGNTIVIQDYNDEITALLATDAFFFHRKKVTIKIGYLGLSEAELLTILTGWVTGLKLTADGVAYEFNITDPIKWMQRRIFRGAETTPITLSGNPINILLACLTSTGAGTNGDHDYLAEENGLGIDQEFINIAALEKIRDDWFPGASHYMHFDIDKRQKAKDFFETEIFKVLNLYPIIDGEGKFFVKRFAPPLITSLGVQTYDEDNIIDLPAFDLNFAALVNEIEFHYNHDGDEYLNQVFFIDSASLAGRGPGKKPITIKSRGLHSDLSPGSLTIDVDNIISRRKNVIFGRFATPPARLGINSFYTQWISEAGDIVPVSHSKLPDIEAGTRGFSEARMEIVKKDVDFTAGKVKISALNTGFAKGTYFVISPSMTVVTGTSATAFTVSLADAAKFANFTLPEVRVSDQGMRSQAASITILTIDTETGEITCDSIGATPAAGWIITFSDYVNCTDEQKLYGFMSDDLVVP